MAASSHRSRLITAGVALPLLAVCVWQGGAFMLALVTAAALAALWEFQGLFPGAPFCARAASLALGALMCWLGWRFGPAAALAVLPAAFWLEELARLWHKSEGQPRWYLAASLAYIPASLQFVPGFSPAETALVMLAVMASDTGAYYAGTLIGGPKIWPGVSPKKTWAGSFGGMAATVAVCLGFGALRGTAPLACFAALGAALCLAAQMGDFMESALKRAAGVKDSGALLPGHGGVLDRIDGMLPAILVYALARNIFGPL